MRERERSKCVVVDGGLSYVAAGNGPPWRAKQGQANMVSCLGSSEMRAAHGAAIAATAVENVRCPGENRTAYRYIGSAAAAASEGE